MTDPSQNPSDPPVSSLKDLLKLVAVLLVSIALAVMAMKVLERVW